MTKALKPELNLFLINLINKTSKTPISLSYNAKWFNDYRPRSIVFLQTMIPIPNIRLSWGGFIFRMGFGKTAYIQTVY